MCRPSALRASILPVLAVGLAGFLASGGGARASDIVTVRVWADPDYVAQRASPDGPKPQTYVVAKGEYFFGACRDGSINENSFPAILHFLAPTLVKQRYFPAKDAKTADQLLVVHWGTTIAYMNDYVATGQTNLAPAALFHDANLAGGPVEGVTGIAERMQQNAMDAASEQAHMAQVADQTAQSMATASAAGLLGYTKQLTHERQKVEVTELERTLMSNLTEDRYFVILQAYDFPGLLQGHARKLLWTAHLSIRSAGTNFTLALPLMGKVASDLYGQNHDELITARGGGERRTAVEIGPITVLGYPSPPAKK
jgi:hypothetical protein